jgi:hypothetical protein
MKNMPQIFYCDTCDYGCSKKFCWTQHLSTSKHTKAKSELMKANEKYECEKCTKTFKHQSSYSRHKKKCSDINSIEIEDDKSDKDLIMMLIKQNTKLIEQNAELVKNGTHNTNSNNTNSLNKTFNLQFFLNETCKDAMNIMDFVDSIKLQLTDLENVGKIGYVEGISNIITTNLNLLDETQRPIHCTDNKREVLYVKDENKWEKENENKHKIRKAIKKIAYKNTKMLKDFKDKHPDCEKSNSKYSDQYNKIIVEAFGGSGNNDIEKENKIIKKISNVTTIDKSID